MVFGFRATYVHADVVRYWEVLVSIMATLVSIC